MQFLSSLTDLSGLGGALLAFIGLVLLAILIVRLGRRSHGARHHSAPGHRLAVLDQVALDEQRRLVLIQRDDIQHLVIVGGGSDFLVEAGIGAVRDSAADIPTATSPARAPAQPPVPDRHEEVAPPPSKPHAQPASLQVSETRPATPATVQRPAAPPRAEVRPEPAVIIPPSKASPETPAPLRRSETPTIELPTVERPTPFPRPSATDRDMAPVRKEAGEAQVQNGPRLAVKIDPLFAGMVDELEETLRRPINTGTARPTTPPPAPFTAAPPITAPAPTPSFTEAPTTPAPAITAAQADTPEPAARFDITASPQSPDVDDVRAPEVRPPSTSSETGPSSSPAPTVSVDDGFELEMADLLGRPRRP